MLCRDTLSRVALILRSGFILRRQMTCTRDEFMSWLPGATHNAPVKITGNELTLLVGGGTVQISLQESAPRRIGPISLPTLDIRMWFSGIDETARTSFIDYFDLYTRRGGG
jgi:hypothetical protein